MSRTISYYFSLVSPWAYMGHARFMDLARRHELAVDYRPVALGNVFADTGGLPLARRHPVRQRYRMLELQRWRARLGLPFKLQPAHWPFDSKLADRLVVAIAAAGQDPGAFVARAFAGVWEAELDLADEATLAEVARDAGLDAPALLAAAKSEAMEARYVQNYRDAVASDAFGSPTYVLDGEVFWGQDRLDFVEDALASGRPPFMASV
ncbi:MAG: 2-hydroxychromene-2-carboxylate isomerase [Methylobacteriaceae bacterium]|nr:2-hydroxychromene-2-carboxylate isomerase [Methylobacteriaceae bacterium]